MDFIKVEEQSDWMPIESQVLIFNTEILINNKQLSYYIIQTNSQLFVYL